MLNGWLTGLGSVQESRHLRPRGGIRGDLVPAECVAEADDAVAGVAPELMGIGPAEAIPKVLDHYHEEDRGELRRRGSDDGFGEGRIRFAEKTQIPTPSAAGLGLAMLSLSLTRRRRSKTTCPRATCRTMTGLGLEPRTSGLKDREPAADGQPQGSKNTGFTGPNATGDDAARPDNRSAAEAPSAPQRPEDALLPELRDLVKSWQAATSKARQKALIALKVGVKKKVKDQDA